MALKQSGVRLIAQGASTFIRQITSANRSVLGFERGIISGSKSVRALDVALGGLVAGTLLRAGDMLLDLGRKARDGFFESIKMAADLEEQMDTVGAIMQLTNDEVAELKRLSKDLGLDPTLKVSTLEAAEAIERLGRQGIDAETIINGLARETIFLANATGSDFNLAANVAADSMKIFSLEAQDMGKITGLVTGLVANSKFRVEDFNLALRNGGAAAAQAGLSLEDFTTIVGVSAEEMGSGMRAGTGLRAFMNRLTPSTKKATEAMMDLGIITEEGKNRFFDAEGQFKSMNDISVVLAETMGTLTAEQKSAYIETLFGIDALGTAVALIDEGQVVYEDAATAAKELGIEQKFLNEFVEGGITGFEAYQAQLMSLDPEQVAKQRIDNMNGALEIFKGVVEDARITLGEKFLPSLTEFIRAITEFVTNESDRILAFFDGLVEILDRFVSGFIAAMSADSGVWDAFLAGLANAGVDREVLDSLDEFVKMVIGFGRFVMDNWRAIFDGIKAITAIIVGLKVISFITGLVSGLISTWGAMSAVMSASSSVFSGIVAILGGPVTATILAVGAVIWGLWYAWRENLFGIQDITKDFVDKVVENFNHVKETVLEIIRDLLNKSEKWWESNKEDIFEIVQNFKDGVIELFEKTKDGILEIITDLFIQAEDWWGDHGESVKVIVGAFLEHIEGRFKWIKERIELIIDTIKETALNLWEKFGDDIFDLSDGFLQDLNNLWEQFKDILGDVVDAIAAAILGDWEEFGRKMRDATDKQLILIQTAFSNSKAKFEEIITNIWNSIVAKWKGFSWESIGQFAMDGLKSGILSKIQAVADAARSVAQAAKDAVTGFMRIESPSRLMYEIGEFVVQGFVDALNDGESNIQEAAEKAFDITGKLSSIAGISERIFKDRVLGRIESGIDQTQEKIGEANRILNHEIERDRLTDEQRRELTEARNRTAGFERTLEGLQSGRLGSHLSDSERSAAISLVRKDFKDNYEALEFLLQKFDVVPFDILSHDDQMKIFFDAVKDGNEQLEEAIKRVWEAQGELNNQTSEYEAQQKKLLEIEEKRADIDFLKSQFDLIKLINENNIDGGILDGIQLGIDADPGQILDATSDVLGKILETLQAPFVGAPVRPPAPVTSPNQSEYYPSRPDLAPQRPAYQDDSTTINIDRPTFAPERPEALPERLRDILTRP